MLWLPGQSDDRGACLCGRVQAAHFAMNDPIYHCPHCHTPLILERGSINAKLPADSHGVSRPEWHCNQCGTTFAPDYFDLSL
jgi:uncharacterized protein with PIN domain